MCCVVKKTVNSIVLCLFFVTTVVAMDRPGIPDADINSNQPSRIKLVACWSMTAFFVGAVAYFGRQIYKTGKEDYEARCQYFRKYRAEASQKQRQYLCDVFGKGCKIKEARDILNVSPQASLKEINHSYKQLALQHHPDKHGNSPGATNNFKKIQEAYELVLGYHEENIKKLTLTVRN